MFLGVEVRRELVTIIIAKSVNYRGEFCLLLSIFDVIVGCCVVMLVMHSLTAAPQVRFGFR